MQKIALGEIEARIAKTRKRLLTAVGSLSEEALMEPNTVGEWSVRDLLAFLSVWYEEVLVGMREIQRRKKPGKLLRTIEGGREFEKRAFKEASIFDLDELLIELDDFYIQVEIQLEQYSLQDLNELKRHRWLGNKQLWPFLAQITYEYEEPYVAIVEGFVKRSAESNPSTPSSEA